MSHPKEKGKGRKVTEEDRKTVEGNRKGEIGWWNPAGAVKKRFMHICSIYMLLMYHVGWLACAYLCWWAL